MKERGRLIWMSQKPATHQRVTESAEQEEFDPVVEDLGKDCGKLYAKLEVGSLSC